MGLLQEYAKVSEQIGKLYSDLEVLEARRAELERQLPNESLSSAPNGRYFSPRHVDKNGIPKAADFCKKLFLIKSEILPADIAREFNITEAAAETRLRQMVKPPYSLGTWAIGPCRLQKPQGVNHASRA